MNAKPIRLLLADDDLDDCFLFKEALEDLSFTVMLTTVHDGVQLLQYLSEAANLPDLLFLDLNMPRKNGFECLSEIKLNPALKYLPVIIFSTSLDLEMVELLYQKGAHHYIRKPGDYSKLTQVISAALTRSLQENAIQPARDQFVL